MRRFAMTRCSAPSPHGGDAARLVRVVLGNTQRFPFQAWMEMDLALAIECVQVCV